MTGSMTASPTGFAPSSSSSKKSKKRSRRDTNMDYVVPASSKIAYNTNNNNNPHQANDPVARHPKKQRVGPAVSTIPRTLPTQPHEELMQELGGKYHIMTTSVISSSKINKKVTSVLSHLSHVDLFDPNSRPGVIMLHARDKDASKMVTVIELAKRKLSEAGQPWFQYNRVYQVAEEPRTSSKNKVDRRVENQSIIEDTILGGAEEDEDEDEEDAFEPMENVFEQAVREKPAAKHPNTYMSMFLARVPIPELQAKTFITLQTTKEELG